MDLYSVFLTPLTYEGLIDEVLHIENGRIKLDSSILAEEKDQVNLLHKIILLKGILIIF